MRPAEKQYMVEWEAISLEEQKKLIPKLVQVQFVEEELCAACGQLLGYKLSKGTVVGWLRYPSGYVKNCVEHWGVHYPIDTDELIIA